MSLDPSPERVLDLLATPLVRVDAEGKLRWLNPAFVSWVGFSGRRFLDQSLDVLDSGEGRLRALVERAHRDARVVRARRMRLAPGLDHERFADVAVTPILEGEGLGGALLECQPVEEFPGGDPTETVPAALHEALKGLAHEVKNPLAGLRGAAQLLARRVNDADALRYLEVITAEADRLSALVERLLNPKPTRELVPMNVHEALERVRLLAEADAGWSVVIQRDYDPSLPAVLGDADSLAQAVWNLVRNALQAGSTEIRLRTRAESHVMIGERALKLAARIEVADNGRGVPEELATRIFLPLVSGRAEGTGLGLTLAQQVAREHGGSLSYRSRPGHTVFTLILPVEETDA